MTRRTGPRAPDGPTAGALVQHLLREAGYPNAQVEVIQTADETLEHTSHWTVTPRRLRAPSRAGGLVRR